MKLSLSIRSGHRGTFLLPSRGSEHSSQHGAKLNQRPLYNLIEQIVNQEWRDLVKVAADIALMAASALWAWFMAFGQLASLGSPWPFVLVVLGVRIPLYHLLRLHRVSWRSVSRYDVIGLAAGAVTGVPIIWLCALAFPTAYQFDRLARPSLLLMSEAGFDLLLLGAVRITARALYGSVLARGGRRTIIVGSSDVGRALASQLRDSPCDLTPIGFVDDDRRTHGRRVGGLPVLGSIADLPDLVRRFDVQQIVIAILSPPASELRRILSACESTGVPARIIPPVEEWIGQCSTTTPLREVRMEDLLPRPEVELDHESICRFLFRKSVLVTGGGGSIGSELCRQAIAAGASQLLVLGRGENSVFEICQELSEYDTECQVRPIICDVRDRLALARVFAEFAPEVVFHAAAHKHVPLMELYPAEAVKNNVIGTLNLVDLAVEYRVERLVMISTDKAVSPSSVMGATKRIGEMIVKAYAAAHDANMVSVRFGNVLGSRGSVVRIMQRQIERRRPVTVTDPDMVRYFMTIPEAVQLVLQAGAIGGKGEVFVLEMGHPVRILDLARDLIRLSGLIPEQDIPIQITGRRPGEKTEEKLLSEREASRAATRGHFRVASSHEVDLSSLLRKIDRLSAAGARGSHEEVVASLQGLIPDFTPDFVAVGGGETVAVGAARVGAHQSVGQPQ